MNHYAINRTKYLEPIELTHLQNQLASDNSRNGLLLRLALATGARAQELLNITRNDLYDNNCTIFIRGLKNSNDREIPIDGKLYWLIKELSLKSKSDKVFDITYSRLAVIWNYYRPVGKTFHSLRHTFAIELYKRTKDLQLVKTVLGHRNIQNTIVYADYVYQTSELKRILVR